MPPIEGCRAGDQRKAVVVEDNAVGERLLEVEHDPRTNACRGSVCISPNNLHTPERGNDFSHAKTTLARIQADCQSPSRDNFTNIRDVETPNDRATIGEHRHLKEVLGELIYLDEELKNAELCRFKTSRR
jgi:hypothetical protein